MQFEQDLQKDCVFTFLEKLIGWCFCPLQPPEVGVKKNCNFSMERILENFRPCFRFLKEKKKVWEEARWEKGCGF